MNNQADGHHMILFSHKGNKLKKNNKEHDVSMAK